MKKILLVSNPEKKRAGELCTEMESYLQGQCEVVRDSSFTAQINQHKADMAVVFGGDGTVLNTVNRLGSQQIPILTVNLGRLGFLAEIPPGELRQALESALAGKSRISRRMLLQAEVIRQGEIFWQGLALNEFAFLSFEHGRMCRLQLEVDCGHLSGIAGDGLLVSTPTGSTGYSLSAGGPILNPELKAMLLVPICPHLLSNRPLVLEEREVLTVRGRALLNCDGQHRLQLEEDDLVRISCSKINAMLYASNSCPGRYDILRRKLGWGG